MPATSKLIPAISMMVVALIMVTFSIRSWSRMEANGLAVALGIDNTASSPSIDDQLVEANKTVEQLSSEIARSESKIAAAQSLLRAIRIENSRFYWSNSSFIEQPVIAFRIVNTGKAALRRVYFHGIVRSPGRTIPWVEDDFNTEPEGGIEPGESRELALEPNMFGPWASESTKSRNDVQMLVTVVNYEGADGKQVIDTDVSDLAEKRRDLASARKRAAELQAQQNADSWW